MRQETTVTISAPCSRVWEVMSDVEGLPELTRSMTSAETLDPGPLQVGSRVRIRQPRLPVAMWTVTELVENHHFTWVATGPGMRTTAEHIVTSFGDDTSQLCLRIDQAGPLGGVVSRLYKGLTERYINLEATGVKRRAEGTA